MTGFLSLDIQHIVPLGKDLNSGGIFFFCQINQISANTLKELQMPPGEGEATLRLVAPRSCFSLGLQSGGAKIRVQLLLEIPSERRGLPPTLSSQPPQSPCRGSRNLCTCDEGSHTTGVRENEAENIVRSDRFPRCGCSTQSPLGLILQVSFCNVTTHPTPPPRTPWHFVLRSIFASFSC